MTKSEIKKMFADDYYKSRKNKQLEELDHTLDNLLEEDKPKEIMYSVDNKCTLCTAKLTSYKCEWCGTVHPEPEEPKEQPIDERDSSSDIELAKALAEMTIRNDRSYPTMEDFYI